MTQLSYRSLRVLYIVIFIAIRSLRSISPDLKTVKCLGALATDCYCLFMSTQTLSCFSQDIFKFLTYFKQHRRGGLLLLGKLQQCCRKHLISLMILSDRTLPQKEEALHPPELLLQSELAGVPLLFTLHLRTLHF